MLFDSIFCTFYLLLTWVIYVSDFKVYVKPVEKFIMQVTNTHRHEKVMHFCNRLTQLHFSLVSARKGTELIIYEEKSFRLVFLSTNRHQQWKRESLIFYSSKHCHQCFEIFYGLRLQYPPCGIKYCKTQRSKRLGLQAIST